MTLEATQGEPVIAPTLEEAEAAIRAAIQVDAGYMTIGRLFARIADGLYVESGCVSFNQYTKSARCPVMKSQAYSYYRGMQVAEVILAAGIAPPPSVDPLRSLTGLLGDPKKLTEVWVTILQHSRETRQPISRKLVSQYLQRRAEAEGRVTGRGRTTAAGAIRAEKIEKLAAEGYTLTQIARRLGMNRDSVRRAVDRLGIEVTAAGGTQGRRRPETNRIINESMAALEGIAMGLTMVDEDDIDGEAVPVWLEQLGESLRVLHALRRTLRERDV